MIRVVFVCLGNICRSPTAEGSFREHIQKAGLQDRIQVESRGTGPWHVGEAPDPRSQECALKNGINISDLRGRQFSTYDFEAFDYILVMDKSNYQDVIRLAKNKQDEQKIGYLLKYMDTPTDLNVPDPYHGGIEGFQNVFNMIDESCRHFLRFLQKEHRL